MQYFPSSLDRWLKTQTDLPVESMDLKEQSSFENWVVKHYRNATCDALRLNWPPETLVATDSAPQGQETWLIFPSPRESPKQDTTWRLSLSKESSEILYRILNTHSDPELDYFRQRTPVCLIRRADPLDRPWIAWKIKDSEPDPQSPPWELLASVLDRLGCPPKFLCDDWIKQLQMWKIVEGQFEIEKQLPMIAHRLLVSKSGLLIPLSSLEISSSNPPVVATIPNSNRKPSTLGTCLGLVLLASILGLSMLALPKKDPATAPKLAEKPAQVKPSEPASINPLSIATETPEELELTRSDDALSQDPVTSLDTQTNTIDSLVANSLSINIRLASSQDPEPKLQQQQTEELPKTEELPNPKAGRGEQAPAQPPQDESVLVISQATQKREFRVERGFSTKKAKGIFTLCLDHGIGDKLHVQGAITQELQGESSGSWRIGTDDLEVELVLSVQSKPGSKWQVNALVQIPSEAGGPLVPIGPKDPAAVLGRLTQYNSWLIQTADHWKFNASGTSRPGQPTPTQLARMYTAKHKDTERAIQRWRQIEQLSLLVFDSARIQVDLQPHPQDPAE